MSQGELYLVVEETGDGEGREFIVQLDGVSALPSRAAFDAARGLIQHAADEGGSRFRLVRVTGWTELEVVEPRKGKGVRQ